MVDGDRGGGGEPRDASATALSVTPNTAADATLWEMIEAIAEAPEVGPAVQLEPGDLVDGDYRIERELGAGGMGVVYLARDLALDRTVAIKLHKRRRRGEMQRYLSEAMALARVGHPSVVAVHRAGVHRGQVYMAMEYVGGGTLRAWLAAQPRGWRDIVEVFVQAGRGLAAAHAAGLVHCDFKPDNVLVGEDGRVRVSDFGLARTATDGGAGGPAGTPAYMAPEQHHGEEIGPAADQFAFCAALWEALCGEPPFGRGERTEVAERADRGPPPPPPAIPRRLRGLLARGLRTRPAERFADLDALLAELSRSLRRRRWPIAAAAVLAAGGVAALLLARGEPTAADPCATAGAPIDEIWSPARRAAIQGAVADPARPWTVKLAQILDGRLDVYARGWRGQRVAACRGDSDEPARAVARIYCLDAQRDILRAAIDVVAGARPADAPRLHQVLAELPPDAWCSGDRLPPLPPAPPPEQAGAAAATQARINDARALMNTGRVSKAEEIVGTLPADADIHATARVELQLLRGWLAWRRERIDEAERHLHAGYLAARATGHTEAACLAASTLVEVLVTNGIRPDRAELWAELAVAEGEAADRDSLRFAGWHALALVREAQGRYPESLALRRREVQISHDLYGDGDFRTASALIALGAIEDAMGDPAQAVVHYQQALAIHDAALGAEHPDASGILANLGLANTTLGRFALAESQLRRALALAERDDPGGPAVAYALLNLGIAQHGQGRFDDAIAGYGRALAILEQRLGADHPDVGLVLNSMGAAQVERGDRDQALALYQRALEVTRKASGADHPTAGVQLANIADLLIDMGRLGPAARDAAAAVAILAKAEAELDLVHALTVQGRAAVKASRPRDARAPLERALAIATARQLDPARTARIRELLAETAAGRRTE